MAAAPLEQDTMAYSEQDGPRRQRPAKQKLSHQVPQEKSSWIYSTFEKRKCCQFIRSSDVKDEGRCCCGRSVEDHPPEARNQTSDAEKWDVDKHTKSDGPTDAYGELEFTGAGPSSRAKFIRISHDSPASDVLTLFKEEWGLKLPNLVISVTGGAKDFVMHPKLKYLFRQGLLKVAQTTGAWIITGGTNTGVMRHVGKAIKGHTVLSRGAQARDKASQLHLIGISTWGIVDHREKLINCEGVAPYHMTTSPKSEVSCIDNNHSHFILVDDGTVGKYGREIEWRANLQNCIAAQKIPRKYGDPENKTSTSDKSNGIPVVLLVLEGGVNTIQTVLKSITSDPPVPVVVAKGSGRAADILAYAYELDGAEMKDMPDVVEHEILLMRIQKTFPDCSQKESRQLYDDVVKCVTSKAYITIYDMNEDGTDIDRAILRGLLKAQCASPAEQLNLALIWNTADIARREIFTKNQKRKLVDALEGAMMDALVNNRVEFVSLLLENGVSMNEFLTRSRLEKLYKAVAREKGSPSRAVFKEFIGKNVIDSTSFSLKDVKDSLRNLVGGTYKEHGKVYHTIIKAFKMGNNNMFVDGHPGQQADKDLIPNPFYELLLWSVLCNMHQMALFMWERGSENLAMALVAGKLYKDLAKLTKRDDAKDDVTEELKAHADEFKRLSLGYLDQCSRTNEELTQKLLMYNPRNWGGQTCLSLAYSIEHEEFLAHVSCQTLLAEIWTGKMKTSQKSSLKTIAGLLFPPAILLLEFHPKPIPDAPKEEAKDLGEHNHAFSSSPTAKESKTKKVEIRDRCNSVYGKQNSSKYQMPWWEKILEFYKSPAAKFWANAFDYMVFLALFSYVILVRQDKIPSNSEIVLIIFVCTLLTEEINQIINSKSPRLGNKCKEWASNKWNILDGIAVVLFFVGLGLRLHPATRGIGHVMYCFDVALWIMRLLDIFSVSKYMGPYVVMIGRMAVDLVYFLLIMVVFFLAYGVAQQAILYPQLELPSWSMASRVFFRPYFQAHGELFMDAPDIIDNTTTVFGTPRHDAFGDTVVSFMTVFYLLIVNILLLNLLIAIFNNTYEKMQAHANQIWKYQRYYLVMEYEQRPVLVPPFIIVNHVSYFIRGLYRWLRNCRRRRDENDQDGVDSNKPKKSYDFEMKVFEERCVDDYIREKDTLLHASQEEKIRVIGDRMETVSCQLQDMHREYIGHNKALKNQLSKLEEDVKKSREPDKPRSRLASIADNPELKELDSRRKRSLLYVEDPATSGSGLTYSFPDTEQSSSELRHSPVARRAVKTTSTDASGDKNMHLRARQSPYPKSNQRRHPVPDFLIGWKESFPSYDPPQYTAPEIQALQPRADADFTQKNPVGRTGIAGRGLLGRWGPNHTAHLIVTRWKIEEGNLAEKKGKNVLEFVAVKIPAKNVQLAIGWKDGQGGKAATRMEGRNVVLELSPLNSSDGLEWAIPGGFMDVDDTVLKPFISRSFTTSVHPALKSTFGEDETTLKRRVDKIVQNAVEVYKGYVDDERNTDDAWVETVMLHFHDEKRETLSDFEFEVNDAASNVKWQDVSGQISLQANHLFILHKVAKLRNAYF